MNICKYKCMKEIKFYINLTKWYKDLGLIGKLLKLCYNSYLIVFFPVPR